MRRLRRDGVALFYEEAGVGEPPMLLVHGLACDHTHLTPQLEHFSDDHRVVAVDLRGHGQSDAPHQEYTIEGFADDLACAPGSGSRIRSYSGTAWVGGSASGSPPLTRTCPSPSWPWTPRSCRRERGPR